ncbi:MFS transporter [Helicobacter burdigaliensis]|uniref:MFS transporter n=1 Tax=Helicobacter burdigaliensis TaxID=2315334 RepID=UPI000EF66568|nr:MFS transporter [Helicobacter burdigaliensis]
MKRYTLWIVMLSSMLTISSLYITQPAQPLFVKEFGISVTEVTLFTSVVLFFLAIAPIFYGYWLEKFEVRKILFISLGIVGILQCLIAFTQSFESFLFVRFLEALVIPAALTSTLTTLTREGGGKKYVNIYVASTVFGGVFSRVVGGFLITLTSWQITFFLLGVSTLLVAFGAYKMPKSDAKMQANKIKPKDILELFAKPHYRLLFFGAFVVLFCFHGVLNFLPFEIKKIVQNTTTAEIGFLYLGYMIGIVAALLSPKISKFFGGDVKAIIFGFLVFASAPLLMLVPSFWWTFFSVFVICVGMFICHSLLSTLVNSFSQEKKGITNGLYLAFYYTGGTIGATMPSSLYALGWEVLCIFMSGVLLLSAFLFWYFRKFLVKLG